MQSYCYENFILIRRYCAKYFDISLSKHRGKWPLRHFQTFIWLQVTKCNTDVWKTTRLIGTTLNCKTLMTDKQILFHVTTNEHWAFVSVITIKKVLHFLCLWIATRNGDVCPCTYGVSALHRLSGEENEWFVYSLANDQWPSCLQFHWSPIMQ
jgi:hypothetical protein